MVYEALTGIKNTTENLIAKDQIKKMEERKKQEEEVQK